jgi:phage tail sheath protein FI
MSPTLIRDVVDTIKAKGQEHGHPGLSAGFRCWFNAADNDPQTLAAGKAWIDYDYTPSRRLKT